MDGEKKTSVRRWENMEIDVLVKILRTLNMVELSPASQVCRSWRLACSDPLIWNTLDLGLLQSNYIPTRASPYVWVADSSDKRLMKVLQLAMALSGANITCLIFRFNLYLKDSHLRYISERCPRLRRLVMPAWNCITKGVLCQALQNWELLESMTMPAIDDPSYAMEQISKSCKNFSELKIMGSFDDPFASSIAHYLPRLRVLSLRCSRVRLAALMIILDNLKSLEVLNISHCLIVAETFSGRPFFDLNLSKDLLDKAFRLKEFHHCQSYSCITCQRMMAGDGYMRWYRYEEWFWRRDEVRSLNLGIHQNLFDDKMIASS